MVYLLVASCDANIGYKSPPLVGGRNKMDGRLMFSERPKEDPLTNKYALIYIIAIFQEKVNH
jgi:hypothetical protein